MSGADDMTPGLGPDEALAMDVALGALGRAEWRAAQARMRSDPAFRAAVEAWQAELAPLDAEMSEMTPPSGVWAAIAAEIEPAPARAAAPAPARSLWDSLMLWRGLAFAGIAAAAIALVPATPPPIVAPPRLLVAALAAPDGTPLLSAAYDPLRGAVVLTPATQRQDEGKSAELWVIEGDKPPRSLGVIDIKDANAHVISQRQIAGLAAGSTLAISIEPVGGSKTGLPSGPVVATGKLAAI
jgi:anti-sigma-K factor RskA